MKTDVVPMSRFHKPVIIILLLLSCLFLIGTPTAGAGIQAYSGDTIPLSGYSPTSNSVYLFLTGPNLPVNGVALNDITKRADEGGFTVVQVNGEDDSWSYKWSTSNINGRLDDGTYTVWVVNGPNDRSNLANAEYGTISVTLGKPTLSISAPVTTAVPGALVITSLPDDSSVTLNGQYEGKTPLTLEGLAPGQYSINITKFGYTPFPITADVGSGERVEVAATLMPERGTLVVNTTPSGANVSLDGTMVGISPVTLINILPGNHTLTLAKDGYVNADQQVAITAGSTVPVTISLSPVSSLSAFPLKTPGLTAGTLLALSLAVISLAYFRARHE